MRPWKALCVVGWLGVLAGAAEPGDDGLKPMFDGKSFDGWKKVGGGATYRMDGDEIVGNVGPGSNTFMRTERSYGDFVLKLDLKLDIPGNSGIQFRSHQQPSADGNGRVFGYQCEVDPSERAWSGGIYDEARRGWLFPLTGHTEAQKAFKVDGWNHYTIVACGPSIRTWLNGVACADLIDTKDLEGFIALQVHSGKAGQIRWKNVRIKDLGQSAWKPLGDGKTLADWHAAGFGAWTIEDGVIHARSTQAEKRSGFLISDADHANAAIRLKFKLKNGTENSGLFIHVKESAGQGQAVRITGLEADIDPKPTDLGGLYEAGGRRWLVHPQPPEEPKNAKAKAKDKAKAKAKATDAGEAWTELAVVALGDRYVVQVNGKTTAEVVDPQIQKNGRIALQVHGGQDGGVEFKDVEYLNLDDSKCPD